MRIREVFAGSLNDFIKSSLAVLNFFIFGADDSSFISAGGRYILKSRLTARLGLTEYNHSAPLDESEYKAKKVKLLLSQHIGKPAEAVVKAGDTVKPDDNIEVRGETLKYVSRGGLKLEKAMKSLSNLNIDMCNVHAAGTKAMMEAAVRGLTREDGTRPLLIAVTQLTSTSEERMRNELLIDQPIGGLMINEIIDVINDISNKTQFPVYVKIHPNSSADVLTIYKSVVLVALVAAIVFLSITFSKLDEIVTERITLKYFEKSMNNFDKENLKDFTIVYKVNHREHIVEVANKKATLNAPLLHYLFDKNENIRVILVGYFLAYSQQIL